VKRLLAWALGLSCWIGCGPATPPNIVLVTLDTVGAAQLSCERAPNVCALGRQGVVFEKALSQSSWTLPSHASLMTGLYPHQHRATNLVTPIGADVPVLAEALAERGFATAAFVSGMFAGKRYGFDRGFATFDQTFSGRRGTPIAGDLTDAALGWLATAPEPFFLWVHYYDPHHDFVHHPDQSYPEGVDAETALEYQHWNVLGAPIVDRVAEQRGSYDALYEGEIRYTDAQLGRLLAGLVERGVLDRSVVAITADHGEAFGEHGLVGHDNLLIQPLIHVPLIIRAPDLEPGVVSKWVETRDLHPTLLERSGGGPQERSLMRPGAQAFAEVQNRNPSKRVAVVSGRHQLTYTVGEGTLELHDLEADPAQQTNLAEREPALTARLRDLLFSTMAVIEVGEEEREELRALGYLD
jgi:arylsulfatase A-like enzyme